MMNSGTITLTKNSTAVTGTGTKFKSELNAGDFIFTTIDGVNYTLGVDSISSETALTLSVAFNGNTTKSQAFRVIQRQVMVGITAQLAADTARAIRGLNYDKANWQQILTGSGNVTVTLPDGSVYSGPSWLALKRTLDNKADKSELNKKANQTDLNSLATQVAAKANASEYAALNNANQFKGSILTNNSASSGSSHWSSEFKSILKGYRSSSGSDMFVSLFMNQVDAVDTFATLRVSAYAGVRDFTFNSGGNGVAPSGWISNSDKRLKTNIKPVSRPLSKMTTIRGVTWDRIDNAPSGIGFIAQSVQTEFPSNVFVTGNRVLNDGTNVEGLLSPDTNGVSAALHHESLLALMSIQRRALLTLADATTSEEEKQSALRKLANLIPDESEYSPY